MKTTMISFLFMAATFLFLPIVSYTQTGASALELLSRNKWVIPDNNFVEKIIYTDSTRTIFFNFGEKSKIEVQYYYLSNTADSLLFQASRIGSEANGRFIHMIGKEDFNNNQLQRFMVSEILVLTENEVVIDRPINRRPEVSVGGGPVRQIPKR